MDILFETNSSLFSAIETVTADAPGREEQATEGWTGSIAQGA